MTTRSEWERMSLKEKVKAITDRWDENRKDARIDELEKKLADWAGEAGRLKSQKSLAMKRIAELERQLALQTTIAQGADQLRKEALEAIPYVSGLHARITELEREVENLRAALAQRESA